MDPNVLLPFGSSALSFVFAALVADQWWRRRQAYQLVWTIGLLWYGISAGTEFLGGAFGWNEPLYRAWYLIGAFGVAAYLGLGTVFLLDRTRFGYVVAFSVFAGGLFSILSGVARAREGDPASATMVAAVVIAASAAALLIALVTRFRRSLVAPTTAAILVAASVVVSVMVLTVPVDAPGYHLDATGVPTGEAFPADLRVLTPPFNIAGAFALVFGAVYSAYIFMPKARVMRVNGGPPVLGAIGRGGRGRRELRGLAAGRVARLPRRHPQLSRPRHDPHRHRRLHPGLDERAESVRGDLGLLPRGAARRGLHLRRLPRQHRGLQRRAAAVHADRAAASGPGRPGRRLSGAASEVLVRWHRWCRYPARPQPKRHPAPRTTLRNRGAALLAPCRGA